MDPGFPTITEPALDREHFCMTSYLPRQQAVPSIGEHQARSLSRMALTQAGVPAADAEKVRAATPANRKRPVVAPGDPQRAHEHERWQLGIPLDAKTADFLTALAANIGVAGPTAAVVTDEEIAS